VTVRDDGPGFSQPGAGGLKLGLENTRARLKQLYGEASSVAAGDDPRGGAIVTMTLPFHFLDEK
jgi:sensor histidine kinase YesM